MTKCPKCLFEFGSCGKGVRCNLSKGHVGPHAHLDPFTVEDIKRVMERGLTPKEARMLLLRGKP